MRHGDGDLVATIDSYNASGIQGTAARADMAGDYAAKFCLSLPEGMVLAYIARNDTFDGYTITDPLELSLMIGVDPIELEDARARLAALGLIQDVHRKDTATLHFVVGVQ